MKTTGTWQWFFGAVAAHWKQVVPLVVTIVISAVVAMAFPLGWQAVMDNALAGTATTSMILGFGALFLVNVVPWPRPFKSWLLNDYELSFTLKIFKHLLRLSIPFYKNKESAKIVMESGKGVAAGVNILATLLNGNFLVDVLVAVFALSYVAFHSMVAGGILIAFIVSLLLLSLKFGVFIAKLREEYDRIDNDLGARQQEVFRHIETVKLHKAEQQEAVYVESQAKKRRWAGIKLSCWSLVFDVFEALCRTLPMCISLFVFAPQVAEGSLTIGALLALQMYSLRAVTPAELVASTYLEFKKHEVRLKLVLELLEQRPTVTESENPITMQPLRHEVCLQNITFTYPNATEPSLHDVSLTIPAGNMVAIVGPTGAGKTTLKNLLVRFYDPDQGVITMDGTDLRQLSFSSLCHQISCMSQEIAIFSRTAGENVAYGTDSFHVSHVEEACRKASADFIFARIGGLETKVNEGGGNFSGGERQRMALARIFLRQPSLVIMDEPTSSLDNITEDELQVAFGNLARQGVTRVFIAHRLSTVQNADLVVVMDKGRIVDTGTHRELLSRCDLYRRLCRVPQDYELAG